MKILHLATHDNFGGAARAAYRQHVALRQQGVDSRMLVRYKVTDDPSVQVFNGNRDWFSRTNRTIRRRWIARLEKQSRVKRGIGLTDPRADLLCQATPEMREADIINFHKTERFVDLPALLCSLPADKPVVITMHDVSPVTGGCDYPGDCQQLSAACGHCPLLMRGGQNDYSRNIFRWRLNAYEARNKQNFALVANSRWTGRVAAASGLAKDRRIEVIHYGLDQSVYSPGLRAEARAALGIGPNEKVLAFAAHDLSLKHKGGHLLEEALAGLHLPESVHLLTMGSGRLRAKPPFTHTHFGRVESDELQSLIYRAADVFVIPSLEEAFGQTALEAIACGSVVTGFKTGGIVDIVENGVNGELVEKGNVAQLTRAIIDLLQNVDLRTRWQAVAQAWVQSRFSYLKNAMGYIDLYESLRPVTQR